MSPSPDKALGSLGWLDALAFQDTFPQSAGSHGLGILEVSKSCGEPLLVGDPYGQRLSVQIPFVKNV